MFLFPIPKPVQEIISSNTSSIYFEQSMVWDKSTGGWRIWTTFHPELQQLLEEVIQQNFAEDAPPGRQIAAVAMDPNSGEVLALSGGRNFKTSSFNRANQARRQPGSALKPLLYATALDQSFRPNSSFEDSVLIYDWEDEGWNKFMRQKIMTDFTVKNEFSEIILGELIAVIR